MKNEDQVTPRTDEFGPAKQWGEFIEPHRFWYGPVDTGMVHEDLKHKSDFLGVGVGAGTIYLMAQIDAVCVRVSYIAHTLV